MKSHSRPRRSPPSIPGDPKALVREGWNRLSSIYRPPRSSRDVFSHQETDYARWLRPVLEGLADGDSVLDLGCGNGVPVARLLSTRFQVTGVDISDVMVRRARRAVPSARFLRGDMAAADFPVGTFGAVVSFYAIIHLPLREQRPLLRRIRSGLRPDGVLVAVLGHGAYEGVETNWLGSGVAMYWSHTDARTYSRWLREAGFSVRHHELIPEGESGHELFWAIAPRRGATPGARRGDGPASPRTAVGPPATG